MFISVTRRSCILDTLFCSPPAVVKNINVTGGQSTGDPHLLTFDGNWFDCQGRGEFVLVKAAATETEVQVRYEPPSAVSGVSLTTGIAASENGSSLVQLTTSDGGGLLVDGAPYDEITGVTAGVDLVISTSSVEMNFASGLNVIAAIRIGYYDISVFAPLTLATTGLLGNNNGEIADDWTVSWCTSWAVEFLVRV